MTTENSPFDNKEIAEIPYFMRTLGLDCAIIIASNPYIWRGADMSFVENFSQQISLFDMLAFLSKRKQAMVRKELGSYILRSGVYKD